MPKIKQQLLINVLNIALSLCINFKSEVFKPVRYNNSKYFRFTLTFESIYLIESYKTSDPAFDPIKCISKKSKNSSTQAISYEVDQHSSKTCKSYSVSNFQPSDIVVSSESVIYIKNSKNISSSPNSSGFKYHFVRNFSCSSKVISLAVLPNGYLASGHDDDNSIKIWDTDTGALIRTLLDHSDNVNSIAVLNNGNLASGSKDNTIKIWNNDTGRVISTLLGHSDCVIAVAVLPNGYLASGSKDRTIKIWNADTGDLISTLIGHTDNVNLLAVLQNGYLASGSSDSSIKIWNTDAENLIYILPAYNDVDALAELRNGYLASGEADGFINIWNSVNGSLIKTLQGDGVNGVKAFAVLNNGYLAAGYDSGEIKIWNADTGSLIETLIGH